MAEEIDEHSEWSRDGDSGGSTITIEPEPSAIFTYDTWDRPGEWVVVLYGYHAGGGTRFSAWLQGNDGLCENGEGRQGLATSKSR